MELHHHRGGSGEPLVLIHGTGSQWQMWGPILALLERERDVIALDLPGFGGSAALPTETPPTPATLADAVASFLDGLEIHTPAIAGNSVGGATALELARRGHARAVVAISPSGFWTRQEARYCRAVLRASAAISRIADPVLPALMGNPVTRTAATGHLVGRPWSMPAGAAVGATRNLATSPGFAATVTSALAAGTFRGGAEIAVPVTIAWGTHDWLLLPRQAPRAQRCIPGSKLVWLDGCGHVPTWDDPELVARVVLDNTRVAPPVASVAG